MSAFDLVSDIYLHLFVCLDIPDIISFGVTSKSNILISGEWLIKSRYGKLTHLSVQKLRKDFVQRPNPKKFEEGIFWPLERRIFYLCSKYILHSPKSLLVDQLKEEFFIFCILFRLFITADSLIHKYNCHPTCYNNFALILATAHGNTDYLERLLIFERTNFCVSNNLPFRIASEFGYLDVLDLLLSPLVSNHQNHLIQLRKDENTPIKTKKYEINPFAKHCRGFLVACKENHAKIVQKYIEIGVKEKKEFEKGFKYAVRKDSLHVVQILISSGISPTFQNNYPIRTAIKFGHLNMVKFLFSQPAVDPTCFHNEAIYRCRYLTKKGKFPSLTQIILHYRRFAITQSIGFFGAILELICAYLKKDQSELFPLFSIRRRRHTYLHL